MTEQQTPDPEAFADALLAAMEEYVETGRPADLLGPADALVDALRGKASESALAAVLDATADVPTRLWTHLQSSSAPDHARVIARGLVGSLRTALFMALHPFDRQDELLAVESTVGELEKQVSAARDQLEKAVDDQDLAAVMALRADAEVNIPGKLAAAQEELLALQLAAAKHRLRAATDAKDKLAERAQAAARKRDAAVHELRRLGEIAMLAATHLDEASTTEEATRRDVFQQQQAFDQHRERHSLVQRDRIRKLAGLAA